jgi:TPR repeat protein
LALFAHAVQSQESTPSPQDLSARDLAALTRLRERPAWLFPAADCPAGIMPAHDEDPHYVPGKCASDLAGCAEGCKSNDAGDCLALALALEERERGTETETDEPIFEALYLRACRLGIASGCTNRAAGMAYREPESAKANACAARTYQKTCRRDDAWGCTMYGFHLMRGKGVGKDPDLAIRMFRKACGFDEEFEACIKAKRLLKEIEEERRAQPESPD